MQCKLESLELSPEALGRAAADSALEELFRNALPVLDDDAGRECKVISAEGFFVHSTGGCDEH